MFCVVNSILQNYSDKIFSGGRIRTSEYRNQNPLPYHLATPDLYLLSVNHYCLLFVKHVYKF